MNINNIDFRADNPLYLNSFKKQSKVSKFNSLSQDTVNFTSKYEKTKELYKKEEIISQKRRELINSRVENAMQEAQKFVNLHPEFDVNDVAHDLILVVVEQTDKEILAYQNLKSDYQIQLEKAKEKYFNKLLNQPEDIELSETLPSNEKVSEIVENKLQKEDIKELMKKLSPQEAAIISKLYGLNGLSCTKEELAEKYSKSIYAINNIIGKALFKLSIPIKAQNKNN